MTVAVNFLTVTNSIAALSISGVTVKDSDEINATLQRQPSVLMPRPQGFITDIDFIPAALGRGDTASADLYYTLHYTYYYQPLGSTLSFEKYATMLDNIATILEAIISNDAITGAIHLDQPQVSNVGPVTDATGSGYFGCEISLRIRQFIN